MKIAIIGSGKVGGTLGVGWARQGHEVIFGVRDIGDADLEHLLAAAGAKATASGIETASRSAEIIVLTVPWSAAKGVIAALGDLEGKVLLDCTNPVAEWPNVDHGKGKSGAEQVAAWLLVPAS